jgi:hypothetical protein
MGVKVMKNLHTITVKFLPATNARGCRVKLSSERFGDSKTISYDYTFNSAVDIAENWLEKNGYRPCFKSEGKNVMMLHCFVFEPLKAAPVTGPWNYYETELKRVTGDGEVNMTFSAGNEATRNMHVNYESSRAVIEWLARGMK